MMIVIHQMQQYHNQLGQMLVEVNLVVLLQSMGLEYVPVLNQEYGFVLPETVEDMLKYAEGNSVLNLDTEREGVVGRSMDGTISFKAISNKFLLKNNQ
jgi:hypothetical protein